MTQQEAYELYVSLRAREANLLEEIAAFPPYCSPMQNSNPVENAKRYELSSVRERIQMLEQATGIRKHLDELREALS